MYDELPEGWSAVCTERICTVVSGGTPDRGNADFYGGTIPWVKSGELNQGSVFSTEELISEQGLSESAARLVPSGSTLVAMYGATAGVVGRLHIDAAINQAIAALIPNSDVDSDYLFHCTCYSAKNLLRETQGSGQPNLNAGMIKRHVQPIPPLAEQRKIAAILMSVDEAIQATEAVIAQTRRVKEGLLQELLTKGIGHTRFKQTEIGEIPEGWEVKRFLDVVSIANGQVDPRKEPYKNWPLIAPNHIESGSGVLLSVETADEQAAISGKYIFEEGDVIYSKIRPYLRKVWLADRKGLCSADMYPIRAGANMDPKFLATILLSDKFSNFAESVSPRTGIPKINREELATYILAVPPLNEQQDIASIVSGLDSVVVTSRENLERAQQLKSGLLQDLLTGRVRVGNCE